MKSYMDDVRARRDKGWITPEEATTLISAQMQTEADGAEAKQVKCPDCGAIHTLVGIGQQFTCACSPAKIQSVWDNRLT